MSGPMDFCGKPMAKKMSANTIPMPTMASARRGFDWILIKHHLINFLAPLRMVLPILRSTPCLERGIPMARASCCLTRVMPNARFQENERPGIFIKVFVELYS